MSAPANLPESDGCDCKVAPILDDAPPTHRWQRPDVPAPLIVWEYVFALERSVEDLQARLKKANAGEVHHV